MTPATAREILGVGRSASREDVKIAYRKLALIRHPDKGGSSEQFQEISEAFSILKDTSPIPEVRKPSGLSERMDAWIGMDRTWTILVQRENPLVSPLTIYCRMKTGKSTLTDEGFGTPVEIDLPSGTVFPTSVTVSTVSRKVEVKLVQDPKSR